MTDPVPGGDLEHAVFAALTELGEATIREVHDRVGVPAGLAYTTTSTVLDRLHEKGLVERVRTTRPILYRTSAPSGSVHRASLLAAIRPMLGGESRPVMASLVDALGDIDPVLVDELAELIVERRGGS